MDSIIFITLAYPGRPLVRTLLLLASLREFGGRLSHSPVWVLYPDTLGEFSATKIAQLQKLGANLLPFSAAEGLLSFPLGGKVQAGAAAEEMAQGKAELLVWLDEDTLILNEPDEFLLHSHRALGFRPVHHKLLGTSWGDELGDFWKLVYQQTGADPERDFRMITHVGEQIRPYFNAGSYVVRPERGLLRAWWEKFRSCYQSPAFEAYYEKDPRYAIFMHQAIWTGTVLGFLERNELQRLSSWINYPLHLHLQIPEDLRAVRIDDLLTVRYEDTLVQPGWGEELPFSSVLADWISSELEHFSEEGEPE